MTCTQSLSLCGRNTCWNHRDRHTHTIPNEHQERIGSNLVWMFPTIHHREEPRQSRDYRKSKDRFSTPPWFHQWAVGRQHQFPFRRAKTCWSCWMESTRPTRSMYALLQWVTMMFLVEGGIPRQYISDFYQIREASIKSMLQNVCIGTTNSILEGTESRSIEDTRENVVMFMIQRKKEE